MPRFLMRWGFRMIDLMNIVLTVIFFALTWTLAVLCDRLSAYVQSDAAPKS
jgi:hypothetical protein